MWGIPDKGPELELFKFGLNFLLLVVTWTLGQVLILRWEEKKRVREISRDMRRQFHELYGQFKSNVRLWRARGKPTDPHDHPDLLEKAVLAEGLVESLLSDLAGLKKLSDDECTALGLFRQGYQTMRQALTNKRPGSVPADYDSDPYHLFNDLTTTVSRLVVEIRDEPSPEEARRSFDSIIDVRTDEWDKAVRLLKEKRPWNQLIEEVTKARREGLEHSTGAQPALAGRKAEHSGDWIMGLEERTRIYLEYLDKEMNIMGILSTFCVGVVAVVVNKAVSAKADEVRLWEVLAKGGILVVIGSVFVLGAALFFYSQRSLLAWYYGQISLCLARDGAGVDAWLKEADSWSTWLRYRVAFGFLGVGFFEYGLSLLSPKATSVIDRYLLWSAVLPIAVTAAALVPWLYVLEKYRYEDRPFKVFWETVQRRGKKGPPSSNS